ncbi:hypothetical protein C8R46DRAFT_1213956 [Mycena filopes]|nr:hypothetical protein C8R46DRAFT_1213956 [Mycena filopes]
MDANDLEKYACRRPCTFVPTTPTSPHSTRILVPLCGPHRLGKIGSAYPYALQSPGPRVIKQIPRQAHWHVRSNIPFVGKLVIFPALIAVSSFLFVPVQPLHRDKEAFNDDWNEFNDLRYSANKFRPSTPHPTRALGRTFVRFPVRRPCTATMEAFRSLSGTSDGTVQTAFEIPAYGEKHKTPEIHAEVEALPAALQGEDIQSYVQQRPANQHVAPVRDLIREGSLYANTRKAFRRFTRDLRKPEKCGFHTPQSDGEGDGEGEDGEGQEEDYDPTEEDLRADDEESFDMAEPAALLSRAMDIVEDAMS